MTVNVQSLTTLGTFASTPVMDWPNVFSPLSNCSSSHKLALKKINTSKASVKVLIKLLDNFIQDWHSHTL